MEGEDQHSFKKTKLNFLSITFFVLFFYSYIF